MVGLCIAVRASNWSLTNRPREPRHVPVDGLATLCKSSPRNPYPHDASSTITAGFPDRSERTRGAYLPLIERFRMTRPPPQPPPHVAPDWLHVVEFTHTVIDPPSMVSADMVAEVISSLLPLLPKLSTR